MNVVQAGFSGDKDIFWFTMKPRYPLLSCHIPCCERDKLTVLVNRHYYSHAIVPDGSRKTDSIFFNQVVGIKAPGAEIVVVLIEVKVSVRRQANVSAVLRDPRFPKRSLID